MSTTRKRESKSEIESLKRSFYNCVFRLALQIFTFVRDQSYA